MSAKSILISGVGGQGALLASTVLGKLLLTAGYDVKISEVHGMAQRGGSVVTHIRYGEKVYSPLIENCSADILLSFEKLESLRWIELLKAGGTVICNTQTIRPAGMTKPRDKYPDDIEKRLADGGYKAFWLDGQKLAVEAGNIKAVNTVMLGVLSKHLDLPLEAWEDAIAQSVPAKLLEVNKKAFLSGREAS